MQRKISENSEYSLAGDSAPGQTLIYHHCRDSLALEGLAAPVVGSSVSRI